MAERTPEAGLTDAANGRLSTLNIYKAYFESDSGLEFSAYGTSRDEARSTLIAALEKWGAENSLNPHWFETEDIVIFDYKTGVGYMDAMEMV